jgi:hypothetical protein
VRSGGNELRRRPLEANDHHHQAGSGRESPVATRDCGDQMIHYRIRFSFRPGSVEHEELHRVRAFLDEIKARGMLHDFTLLRSREAGSDSTVLPFEAVIVFADNEHMSRPFRKVAEAGFRTGSHGAMIENVQDFVVETWEEA